MYLLLLFLGNDRLKSFVLKEFKKKKLRLMQLSTKQGQPQIKIQLFQMDINY